MLACSQGPRAPRIQISVAALSLPGVGELCYDLRTTNGPAGSGQTVWVAGAPLVDGDADALCTSSFGNGSGGDLTFVGTCDATPVNPGDPGRTNSVTVWVDKLTDTTGTPIAPNGPDGWQDPCPSGCTLETLCQENTDAKVEFNLTILRQANQGFFDIGVNFDDIFCSAKVDCRDGQGEPLKLLFNAGQRDTTVVSALACTAGPGVDIRTFLYRAPLVLTCDAGSVTLPAVTSKGNVYAPSNPDPNLADVVWQYANFLGEEALSCAGSPCNKLYWNVAIGLDPTIDNCILTTRMSAARDGTFAGLSTPAATTYPYIDVNVRLTDASGLACNKHPLNGDGSGVSTRYTPINAAVTFTQAYSALVDECQLNTDNCHANATCTDTASAFSCACNPGYSGNGVTCADNDECQLNTDNCHTHATCTNTTGSFSCACNSGYSGDGVSCTDNDECLLNTDNCHANATCTNTAGSFSCACNGGYSGDGVTCTSSTQAIIDIDPYLPASYPGTGSTVTNLGSSGGTFALTGGPTFSNGSLLFDGVDDSVNLGTAQPYSRSAFSVFAWFKYPTSHVDWRASIVSKWTSGAGDQNEWSLGAQCQAGPCALGAGVQLASGALLSVNDGTTYETDTWYHLGFVWDRGILRLYKNGVPVATTTSTSTSVDIRPIPITLARLAGGYQANIRLGKATLYDGALTDSDVLSNFNATKARYTPTVSDADALSFLLSTGISDAQQAATLDTLVSDLKAAGLWSKMKAIYPFVGGSAYKHKFNLKDARDLDAAYRLQFSGGWAHTSQGAKPDGTGYARTYFTPKNAATAPGYNLTAGMYFRTNTTTASMNGVWANDPSGPGGGPFTLTLSGSTASRYIYDSTATSTQPPRFDGLHSFGKRDGTASFYRHNLTATATSVTNGTPTDGEFHWGRSNGQAGNGETREFAFAYLADGLSDADLELLYPIVQRYQASLNREVGVPLVSDADAYKFLVAANITSSMQALAVNTLATDLKAGGVWTRLRAAYPFVGGSASSHKFNLKDPRDANDAFRLQFNGGWTHTATGVTGNATDTWADTYFDPSVQQSLSSFHMSIYSRTNTSEYRYDMGNFDGTRENSMIYYNSEYYGNFGDTSGGTGTNFARIPTTVTTGQFLVQIDGTGRDEGFRNGVLVNTVTSRPNYLVPRTLYLGANNSPTNRFPASKNYAFASIGDAMTDAQALAYYQAVQKFQTTLNRQIGAASYDLSLGSTVVGSDILLSMNASTYTSGTTWFNATNTNHATLVNGPTYLSGDSGGVFGLDGSNDYITFGDVPYTRSSFSVFIYYQFRSFHTNWDGSVISKWYTGAGFTGNEWSIGPGSQGGAAPIGVGLQTTNGSNNLFESVTDTVNYTLNQWNQYGLTFDNGVLRMYRNGELVGTKFTTYRNIPVTTQPITIGTTYNLASYLTDAKVGDVHMYNRALTPSEVLRNFNVTRGRFGL
jgi:hypothetical protein